jgi:hypothetical protein
VPQDYRHKGWLQFIRKIVDVPSAYSKEDLLTFRSLAVRQHPALVSLIDAYLSLAENSDSDAMPRKASQRNKTKRHDVDQMHLFDLLRQRQLFPSNLELARFAARVLPNMRSYRFDKMSKGDIASRIIEYLETRDPGTRERLEVSMREAMSRPPRVSDRRSFLSKWEKIIKGIEL